MNVGNLANPEYLRQQFWRDLDPEAEAPAWASSEMVFSSSVSGLLTADLQCDLRATFREARLWAFLNLDEQNFAVVFRNAGTESVLQVRYLQRAMASSWRYRSVLTVSTMSLREMIEHPPNISDLPIWRKILLACSLAFFVFVFVAGIDKHLTIYGSAPDHPVAETGQIFSVSVMHGYIRYVTLRERESYLLWAGSAGSWPVPLCARLSFADHSHSESGTKAA